MSRLFVALAAVAITATAALGAFTVYNYGTTGNLPSAVGGDVVKVLLSGGHLTTGYGRNIGKPGPCYSNFYGNYYFRTNTINTGVEIWKCNDNLCKVSCTRKTTMYPSRSPAKSYQEGTQKWNITQERVRRNTGYLTERTFSSGYSCRPLSRQTKNIHMPANSACVPSFLYRGQSERWTTFGSNPRHTRYTAKTTTPTCSGFTASNLPGAPGYVNGTCTSNKVLEFQNYVVDSVFFKRSSAGSVCAAAVAALVAVLALLL